MGNPVYMTGFALPNPLTYLLVMRRRRGRCNGYTLKYMAFGYAVLTYWRRLDLTGLCRLPDAMPN
jgi:hypothetical protein